MKLARAVALALLAAAGAAAPALAARVSGRVLDRDGRPIEFATVSVAALKVGAVTDDAGAFELDLPDGRAVLEVGQIGYRRARLDVVVAAGLGPLHVVLAEAPVPVSEVQVTASSFGKAGKSEGAVVRRMDVLTTPGGAADVFQSLRALPGINAPSEGAALFVRGGDPSETLVRLDGGEIGHPYHYEGASGGLFSAFDAYMLKSAFFSSGGFSAKYGGVLSGVLDVETQDPMNTRTVSAGANLAGGALSSSWALVPDRLSLVATLRRSWPAVLVKLYGSARDYESAPASDDGAARLLWRYRPTGRASLLFLGSGDAVAMQWNVLNTRALARSGGETYFASLQVSDVVGRTLAVHARASAQWHDRHVSFVEFAQDRRERNAHAGVDAVWRPGDRHEVSFGAQVRRLGTRIGGTWAADSTDWRPGAPSRSYTTDAATTSPGLYLEDKVRLVGPVYATLGGRVDRAPGGGRWTADPRAALAWRVDAAHTVRLATGRYHQLADARWLDPAYGNPDLAPLRADHVIAGWEWRTDDANVRLEAYRKDYRDLVTQDAARFYANGGHGVSRGVDVFVQGSRRWLSGWISYGWMDARRKEGDDVEESPSAWGVRHSATVVGQVQLSPRWTTGLRWGGSTGRTYTPVVGRTFDDDASTWRPVWGAHGSAEYPPYSRLDVRLTRLFALPAGAGLPASSVCVAYLEAMNVLGTRNVLEYVWNSDYSRRYAMESYFSRRLFVAGVQLTW